ncbi:MAG: hypothetical protein AAGF99_04500 [Bacteroidota bacterium]
MRYTLALLLIVPVLSMQRACTPPIPMGSSNEQVRLASFQEGLNGYEDQSGYDFVDDYQYMIINNQSFDDAFRDAAVLAARLHQIREVAASNREGAYAPSTSAPDFEFLTLMVVEALTTLPGIVGEANNLSSRVSALNPNDLSPLQYASAIQGLDQARRNLQAVLDFGSNVDDVLDDYRALQEDLNTIGVDE